MQSLNLSNLKPATTLDLSRKSEPLNEEEETRFRKTIGSMQYNTTIRPDIAYSVKKVSQFMTKPPKFHWTLIQHILRDLSANLFVDMHLKPMEFVES